MGAMATFIMFIMFTGSQLAEGRRQGSSLSSAKQTRADWGSFTGMGIYGQYLEMPAMCGNDRQVLTVGTADLEGCRRRPGGG